MAEVRRNILINQPRSSYFVGGAEMVSIEHAKNLAIKGYDVTFVTIKPTSINYAYSAQYLKFKKLYLSKISFIEVLQQAKAAYWYSIDPGEDRDRWNVESLYFNSSLYQFLEASEKVYDVMISYYKLDAVVLPREKIKTNALYLCGVPRSKNIFMSSFLAMYDRVIAITEEVKDYWQPYTQLSIHVVAAGVDADRFSPIVKKNEFLKVLYIGRLVERKGIDVLIEACSLLPDSLKDNIEVIIAGDGPQLPDLQDLVKEKNLAHTVHFVAMTDTPEKLMSAVDICVFPSKRGEGLQGVILESMASGAYVIASDTSINRVIIGSERGSLIDPQKPQDIASVIADSVRNRSRRIFASESAVKFVKTNYNWGNMVDKLMELIE